MTLFDDRPGRSIELQVVPVADVDEEDDGRPPPRKLARPRSSNVHVMVAQDRTDLDRTKAMLLSALLMVAALMAIGTVAIVAFSVRVGLRPLEQVAQQAAAIDARSLDVRFPTNGLPVELKPICQRLNESLKRLEDAFKRSDFYGPIDLPVSRVSTHFSRCRRRDAPLVV
jgi:methyl-accepting chemotaxis protein